jgi:hypothetical protein
MPTVENINAEIYKLLALPSRKSADNLSTLKLYPIIGNYVDCFIAACNWDKVKHRLSDFCGKDDVNNIFYQTLWQLNEPDSSVPTYDTKPLHTLLDKWNTTSQVVQDVSHQELALLALFVTYGFVSEIIDRLTEDKDFMSKLITSLLAVLNNPSLGPSRQALSITSVAFLIPFHECKDSILSKENVKALLRMCLNRSVNPEPCPVTKFPTPPDIDAAFARISVLQLLSVDAVALQTVAMKELKNFIDKWWIRVKTLEDSETVSEVATLPYRRYALQMFGDLFYARPEVRDHIVAKILTCSPGNDAGISFLCRFKESPDFLTSAAAIRLLTYFLQDITRRFITKSDVLKNDSLEEAVSDICLRTLDTLTLTLSSCESVSMQLLSQSLRDKKRSSDNNKPKRRSKNALADITNLSFSQDSNRHHPPKSQTGAFEDLPIHPELQMWNYSVYMNIDLLANCFQALYAVAGTGNTSFDWLVTNYKRAGGTSVVHAALELIINNILSISNWIPSGRHSKHTGVEAALLQGVRVLAVTKSLSGEFNDGESNIFGEKRIQAILRELLQEPSVDTSEQYFGSICDVTATNGVRVTLTPICKETLSVVRDYCEQFLLGAASVEDDASMEVNAEALKLPFRSPFKISVGKSTMSYDGASSPSTSAKLQLSCYSQHRKSLMSREDDARIPESPLSPSISSPPIRRLRHGKTPVSKAALSTAVTVDDNIHNRQSVGCPNSKNEVEDVQSSMFVDLRQWSMVSLCPSTSPLVSRTVPLETAANLTSLEKGGAKIFWSDDATQSQLSPIVGADGCFRSESCILSGECSDYALYSAFVRKPAVSRGRPVSEIDFECVSSPNKENSVLSSPVDAKISLSTTLSPSIFYTGKSSKKQSREKASPEIAVGKTPFCRDPPDTLACPSHCIGSDTVQHAMDVTLTQQIFDLKMRVSECECSEMILKNQNAELEKVKKDISEELKYYKRQYKAAELSAVGVQSELDHFKGALSISGTRITDLEGLLASADANMSEVTKTVGLQEKALQDAWNQLSIFGRNECSRAGELAAAKHLLADRESKLRKCVEHAELLEAGLKMSTAKLAHLLQRCENLEEACSLSADSASLQKNLASAAEMKLHLAIAAETALTHENNRLKEQLCQLANVVRERDNMLDVSQQTVRTMNALIASKDSALQCLNGEMEAYRRQLEEMRENTVQKQAEIQNLKTLLQERDGQHQHQINGYHEQTSMLEDKVTELNQELEKHQQLIVMINKLSAKPSV